MGIALPCTHSAQYTNTSSGALQPGVGLGLLCKTPPNLSVPCSVSPFVYSHLSQVRGHVIQPSHFWSSSSSCCIQLSVHLVFGIAVSCILSVWPNYRILWPLINLTMFFPVIMASNSSFRRILYNSFSFTGPYIFHKIFLSNATNKINITQKKLCVRLFTYRNYTKMYGQKNIRFKLFNP